MNVSNAVCSNSARPLAKENQGSGASCSTWIGQRGIKSGQLPVDFGKRNIDLPTHPGINGQLGSHLPVVLKVSGIVSLPVPQDDRIRNVGNVGETENEISEGVPARVICIRSGIANAING